MGVFAIVMTSLASLIRHTVRFYNTQVMANEVQQQAILATRWLSQELDEGSITSIKSLATPTQAVIFGSPRDKANQLRFDGETKLWQKFVCYYIHSLDGKSVLLRGVLEFDSPAHAPPPVPSTITVTSFVGTDVSERIMARHINSIQATIDESVELSITASLDDGAYTLKLTTRVEMGS